MPNLLEAENVSKTFGGGVLQHTRTVAVDEVSLVISVARPSITAIAGESGSGKTTLARLLLGITAPTSGSVIYQGRPITEMTRQEHRLFRREVQVIFQDPFEVYNPFYKVDHVLTGPLARFGLAAGKAKATAMMSEALETVGLRPEETLGRYPHQLSGGQRQRVMVARALLLRPKVLIADEPVSMVDASLRATILDSLLRLYRDFGISIVYITHDLTTAFQVAETIAVLYRGSIAEIGDVDAVIKAPRHPYTKLLVGSMPRPDPRHKWERGQVAVGTDEIAPGTPSACKFANRCPEVMPVCRERPPPLFDIGDSRAAACFLNDGHPSINGTDAARGLLAGTSARADGERHQHPPAATT
jgi:oligopeptide/dipeptide ABC transporter ATP-binding protein